MQLTFFRQCWVKCTTEEDQTSNRRVPRKTTMWVPCSETVNFKMAAAFIQGPCTSHRSHTQKPASMYRTLKGRTHRSSHVHPLLTDTSEQLHPLASFVLNGAARETPAASFGEDTGAGLRGAQVPVGLRGCRHACARLGHTRALLFGRFTLPGVPNFSGGVPGAPHRPHHSKCFSFPIWGRV